MTNEPMQIYSAERTAAACKVHLATKDATRIEGTLRGPFCKYSRTLPSTMPIRDGIVTVVDPCYWTPRLPFRYEIKLNVESASGSHELEFMWGMRWCVPHRSNLFLDGRGYVIRAAECCNGDVDVDEFRAHSCSLLAKQRLPANVYETASESGVLIVDLDETPHTDDRSAAAIALQPAVHVLHAADTRTDALSLDLDQSSKNSNDKNTNVLLQTEATAKTKTESSLMRNPILVERQIAAASLSDMRRECDTLQSDLAKHGQFAGYLISSQS